MQETNTNDDQIESELEDLDKLIPAMNVTVPSAPAKQELDDLITDGVLLGLYGELLDMTRQDRVETAEYVNNFAEMIFNGGDSSNGSKEALVQLMKLKMDSSNNMTKIADLMTRIKLKDRYTADFAPMNASQTNNINIGVKGNQRKALMQSVENTLKKKKDTE
jgi:hypothetical protein